MAKRGKYQYEAGADEELRPPSRSQKKRDSTALQDLGEKLAQLPQARLADYPIPTDLLEALKEYHQLSGHEAKRRQLQYVGRLMREARDEGNLEDLLRCFPAN